jgi:hypothetical protein
VSSFAGAFGSSLRETRLTAMLGYLIALEPAQFCNFFGFLGRPLSVSLETPHASDRSDILIETTAGRGAIEAKVTATDPFRQSLKYPAKWRVLLTEHSASAGCRARGIWFFKGAGLDSTSFETFAMKPPRRSGKRLTNRVVHVPARYWR